MKLNFGIFLFLFISLFFRLSAQDVKMERTDSSLSVSNGLIYRSFRLPKSPGPFYTTEYRPSNGTYKYFNNSSKEFSFLLRGKEYSGHSTWQLNSVSPSTFPRSGSGVSIILQSTDHKVEVVLDYILYPQLPLIRKRISVRNLSAEEVSLEAVDVERFSVNDYYPLTFSWIMSDYGRRKHLAPYKGSRQDALVIVHDPDQGAGLVIGNEGPGVLKKTNVFYRTEEIRSGLTDVDDAHPFRKWLKPGEIFNVPEVFTIVYNATKNHEQILNGPVSHYLRKYLGARISETNEMPRFLYNTWTPFQKDINEQLIYQLADAAAAAGMKEFIIDDGWQDNYGDWNVNKAKFPNGLKPVFDYIKKLGMKPGLWISMGTAQPESKIFSMHEDWFIRNRDGSFTSQANWMNDRSACLSTGWYEYIRDKIIFLINEYGLEYVKLDFAVVTSAYKVAPDQSGCYAQNHPGHKDHHESLWSNYTQLWRLFDDLHKEKEDLFIDCTFEAMGGLQLVDYAMLKHAEGNWLSNFDEPAERGALRIRNMAWWRSPAMPATALVIGNAKMNDPDFSLLIKSLIGTLPMMLGDPRQLTADQLATFQKYSQWLSTMELRYQVLRFRQDIGNLGEPAEGQWDGFQRINTDTRAGGIFGVFRHGSRESKRTVTLSGLDQDKRYLVKDMNGRKIGRFSGAELINEGIQVQLKNRYDGALFEVFLLQ